MICNVCKKPGEFYTGSAKCKTCYQMIRVIKERGKYRDAHIATAEKYLQEVGYKPPPTRPLKQCIVCGILKPIGLNRRRCKSCDAIIHKVRNPGSVSAEASAALDKLEALNREVFLQYTIGKKPKATKYDTSLTGISTVSSQCKRCKVCKNIFPLPRFPLSVANKDIDTCQWCVADTCSSCGKPWNTHFNSTYCLTCAKEIRRSNGNTKLPCRVCGALAIYSRGMCKHCFTSMPSARGGPYVM